MGGDLPNRHPKANPGSPNPEAEAGVEWDRETPSPGGEGWGEGAL